MQCTKSTIRNDVVIMITQGQNDFIILYTYNQNTKDCECYLHKQVNVLFSIISLKNWHQSRKRSAQLIYHINICNLENFCGYSNLPIFQMGGGEFLIV